MKMLIGLLTLILSVGAFASTGETQTFFYDGSQNSVEMLLRGEKTHTEYRYEQVRTTCFRTETYYRTECYGGGWAPGRDGRPVPVPRVCHQVPMTRSVPYPCTRTVSVPYEVKDYDVEARVVLDVTNMNEELKAAESFRVSLHGDTLSLSVNGSKRYFVMLKKKDVQSSMNGSVKFLDGLYAVELIEAAPVMSALSITNIGIKNNVLNFQLGPVASTDFLGFSVRVEKRKLFGSDPVLVDRELALSEVTLTPNSNGTEASVKVSDLGVTLSGGKFDITAKAFFKADGKLLNADDFRSLEASRTLIFTNR